MFYLGQSLGAKSLIVKFGIHYGTFEAVYSSAQTINCIFVNIMTSFDSQTHCSNIC